MYELEKERAIWYQGNVFASLEVALSDLDPQRSSDSMDKWFDELSAYARREEKIPILTLRKPNSHRRLAVIDFDFLIELLNS